MIVIAYDMFSLSHMVENNEKQNLDVFCKNRNYSYFEYKNKHLGVGNCIGNDKEGFRIISKEVDVRIALGFIEDEFTAKTNHT